MLQPPRTRANQGWGLPVVIGIGLTAALGGCQSIKGISQCNQVLSQINTSLELATELHAKPPTSGSYQELSDVFGQLESQLATHATSDGDLARATKGYAKQMRKVSREARNYAQALGRLEQARDGADAEEEKKARDELSQIRTRAERLIDGAENEGRKLRDSCRPRG